MHLSLPPLTAEQARTRPLQAPQEPLQSPGSVEPATAHHRILVVDDNRASAQTLALLMKLTGHEVLTAHDGLEAVQIATATRPDVILLDIGLPKLNGYEVARKIREQAWGHDTTLIALTGWSQQADKQRAQEAGFDHHVAKPVKHSELTALLARLPAGRGPVEKFL